MTKDQYIEELESCLRSLTVWFGDSMGESIIPGQQEKMREACLKWAKDLLQNDEPVS